MANTSSKVIHPISPLPIHHACSTSQPTEPGQALDPSLRKSSAILEQLTKAVPGLLEGLFLLAKVRYLSNETNEAKAVLRRIIDQEATYSDAYILLAQVYAREGNSHLAYESLENGLSYNFDLKNHPIYHLIRARILKKEKKYDEACKLLQTALNLPGVKKRSTTDGPKTPRSKAEQAVSSVPISIQDRVGVFLELAEIQLLLNRVHEATIILQEASSEFHGTSEESRILLTNVDLSLKRGDVNHAIETLMQIKADQPYYIQAREKLAEVYLKHRHDKKLYIKTYKELVDRDPKPESLVILGDAYMSIMEVREMRSTRATERRCPCDFLARESDRSVRCCSTSEQPGCVPDEEDRRGVHKDACLRESDQIL